MPITRGKQFEKKFQEDFLRSFPEAFLMRLPDQVSGYKVTSQNPCDFIGYCDGRLYLLECKSHKGNTFPLDNLTQYEKLLKLSQKPGVFGGVVLWMIEHDTVFYLPISFIEYLKETGHKSFNVKMTNDDQENKKFIVLPSVKKRVFLDTDYKILKELEG